MEPAQFVAEIYRRMQLRSTTPFRIPLDERIAEAAREYAPYLPQDKSAPILDVGFGSGWFMLACKKLGYTEVHGAEFGIDRKEILGDYGIVLHEIKTDIGGFLSDKPERFAFVHMSHVIEHVPKYSLLWLVDGLYYSLKRNGTLFLRTPNMEGPAANSAYYVTLGHEYGFCGSNLRSLLDICGFEDVRFHSAVPSSTLRQHIGNALRAVFLLENRIKNRLFGANVGNQFGSELIVSARRGESVPLFDPKYR